MSKNFVNSQIPFTLRTQETSQKDWTHWQLQTLLYLWLFFGYCTVVEVLREALRGSLYFWVVKKNGEFLQTSTLTRKLVYSAHKGTNVYFVHKICILCILDPHEYTCVYVNTEYGRKSPLRRCGSSLTCRWNRAIRLKSMEINTITSN